MNIDMGHVNAVIFIDNLYLRVFVFFTHSLVQFFNIRNQLGNNLLQICQRPFFQSLSQNGMICVCTGFSDHFDGLIHGKSFLLYQNSDQFRNYHGWMGIIDLDHCVVIHFAQIKFVFLHFPQDQLCGVTYHKVLLIDTKQIAGFIRIIRIQEQGQVLFDCFFIKINSLFHQTLINRLQIK